MRPAHRDLTAPELWERSLARSRKESFTASVMVIWLMSRMLLSLTLPGRSLRSQADEGLPRLDTFCRACLMSLTAAEWVTSNGTVCEGSVSDADR